jgi:hypothetical protein
MAGACILAMLPGAVAALQPEQGKGKGSEKAEKKKDQDDSEFSLEFLVDFTSDDARRYAREAGLVGQKSLPPGIRKNLARGKPLPPGIAKRSMPDSFLKKLPRHDDYEWRMAGADLVLIARSDNVVVEIAADIFK